MKILLCVAPISCSAECVFSVLDRVKTKLRNNIGNAKISHLVTLNFYPVMVDSIDLIYFCNNFIKKSNMKIKGTNYLESLYKPI